jgi:hypothetical protein
MLRTSSSGPLADYWKSGIGVSVLVVGAMHTHQEGEKLFLYALQFVLDYPYPCGQMVYLKKFGKRHSKCGKIIFRGTTVLSIEL